MLDELSHGFVRVFVQSPHLRQNFSSQIFSNFFNSFSLDTLLEEVLQKNSKTKSLFSKTNKRQTLKIEIMSKGSEANRKISKGTDQGSGGVVDNFDVMSSGDVGVSRKKVEVESELSAVGFSEAFNSKKGGFKLYNFALNVG